MDKVDEGMLLRLVADGVAEAKHIEYKRDIPADKKEDRLEFLRDAASFANAEGGLLLYGMTEESGIPKDLPGVGSADLDQEILRLESMLRDNVDPRIEGVRSKAVALSNGRQALVMRIPKSWRAPHMIVMDGRDNAQFYTRATNGKHRMDLTELRSVLAGSLSRNERLREFRSQRLWRILARELPEPLQEGPVTVLHLLPASMTEPGRQMDMLAFATVSKAREALAPYYGDLARFCLDGFIIAGGAGRGSGWRYLLAFRNGAMELVRRCGCYDDRGVKRLPGGAVERYVRDDVAAALQVLCRASVQPPMFVSLSLLGAKGLRFGHDLLHRTEDDPDPAFERDELVLRDVEFDEYPASPDVVVRPLLDSLWNAVGDPGSRSYDETEQWNPDRR
jgi:hypothetical protein